MTESAKAVIIVAGGIGARMKAGVPKQFIMLSGKPVLMHTIHRFLEYDANIELIVVLPENQLNSWKYLCEHHDFRVQHKVVTGGETRFASVKKGLEATEGVNLVAVHDGVRPFVPVAVIANAFETAQEKGNAVVAVALKDSIREVTPEGNNAADRSRFMLIQTPQCFRVELLKKAYETPEETGFTDDASVVEKLGEKINLVEGSYENFKITTPEDMLWAEAILKKKSE